MSQSPFQDPHTNDLLSRVSHDVSLLRQDVGNLFHYTTRHQLPSGVRTLAESAKETLAHTKDYSADQLRYLRSQVSEKPGRFIGGAILVGLLAAGAYVLANSVFHSDAADDAEYDDE